MRGRRPTCPPGPYFHGSRREYEPGDPLLTDILSYEDRRLVCFATTRKDAALDWACRRGVRHGGDTLFVYEVEMVDPDVDTNMHMPGSDDELASVMSHHGVVLSVAEAIPTSDCPSDPAIRMMRDTCNPPDQ